MKLRNILRKDDSSSVFYCYWNNYYSYAACELKNKLSRIKVVSRTHRYDLYESQSSSGYLPLKRQYAKNFDKIFFLSAEGKQYFEERYGIESSSAEVSPLGVPIPKVESAGSNDGEFHVVSLSFCAPIKRIDKIIDAIALFAENNTDVKVRWTHIGGGSLLEMLKELAVSRLGKANNVSFEFAGMMENRLAKDFFVSNPVDVFVNSSESEGIPVSIMEAMSTGIPAIAPNIGGIAFLIDEYNGVLLSDSPDANEISLAFEHVFYHEGIDTLRRRAREKIQNEYSAEINYARFVDTLNNL
ncbi:glycosyltransferase [Halomonas sp. DP8Y7-1]|uniref:glycosyltransferase n=1 Tax=Halomonas sp. DP8Y7-1 TaxID=2859078 RepID=UPI001C947669|nr:glycosyltransferase [Halomonas sp. DP8Y7-1]MBY6030855.1 glycosyltransferase [Halomonas sp. DP8Y7-1]